MSISFRFRTPRYCSQVSCESNSICPFEIACGHGGIDFGSITVLAHD